jgi:dsDNA-binding SOS-regulon protein
VYDPDGDGLGTCWFRPLEESRGTFTEAQSFCSKFDPDAYLVELDTAEKSAYFLQNSGVLQVTKYGNLSY